MSSGFLWRKMAMTVGIQHDSHEPAGIAVVIEVDPRQHRPGLEDHRRVEKTGQQRRRASRTPRRWGQRGAEEGGQLHGGVVEIEVHERTAQDHAPDDGQDVLNVLCRRPKSRSR